LCARSNIFGGPGCRRSPATIHQGHALAFTHVHRATTSSEQKLVDAVANVTGKPRQVAGPAGSRRPIGVEHRRLSGVLRARRRDRPAGDGGRQFASSATSGTFYSVSEAYAELRAPLLAGVTGGRNWSTVNAAARVSDYSFLSPELHWQAGRAPGRPMKDLVGAPAATVAGSGRPASASCFGSKGQGFGARSSSTRAASFNGPGVPPEIRARCIALGLPLRWQLFPETIRRSGSPRQATALFLPETSNSVKRQPFAYSPEPSCRTDRGSTASISSSPTLIFRLHKARSRRSNAQYQIDRCGRRRVT